MDKGFIKVRGKNVIVKILESTSDNPKLAPGNTMLLGEFTVLIDENSFPYLEEIKKEYSDNITLSKDDPTRI